MGWYPANQGNGLDRVFYSLVENEAAGAIRFAPIVVTSGARSDGRIRVVDESQPLHSRMRAVARAFDDLRPGADLVAAHFAPYAFSVLRSLGDLPLVVHFHGPWAAESRMEGEGRILTGMKRWLEKRVYHRADRLIVLSTAFRDVLMQDYGVDVERVDVVPGGVDLDRFTAAPDRRESRRRLDWPLDRPIVLSVRRLVKRMGLENLLAATEMLKTAVPEILILIAGRGPLQAELQHRIEALGLQDHVRLLGFVREEDLPLAYSAADVSVVPTVGLEGFGLIAAESLAAGTPSLVTPVGGLPEVVSGLSSDLVFDGTTPGALADRISAVLLGTLPLPSRDACRRFAVENFDWRMVVRRTREVYDRALA